MREQEERAQDFVAWLQEHGDDRGLMAELRRGLAHDREWRAWKHLARWCDLTRGEQRLAFATVGGGFATHPRNAATGNLGDTARAIAIDSAPGGADPLGSFEGRFRRLLTCESIPELAERVGAMVRAAKQREIAINYGQLLTDILSFRWPKSRERTKIRWAAAFWRSAPEPGETGEAG
ncbi:MAG: type I-E CRISPR-associated protein Cse2/CasB [Candidatus Latescibacterota bacterium]|jgi:CRISPR type I-E-associated protein CasB/Cse2